MPQHVIPMLELQQLSPQQLLDKYGLDMLRQTKAYYEQNSPGSTTAGAQPQQEEQGFLGSAVDAVRDFELPDSTGERIFETTKIEHDGQGFRGSDVGTALGNIPSSVEGLIRGFGDLIHSAPEIADAFIDRPVETATEFGKAVVEPFTSMENFREYVVENPADMLTNFIPGAGQVSKIKSLPRLARSVAKLGSPSELGAAVGARVGRAGQIGAEVASGAAEIATGMPSGTIRTSFNAGLEGNRAAFRAAQKRRIPDSATGQNLAEHIGSTIGADLQDVHITDMLSGAIRQVGDEFDRKFVQAQDASALGNVGGINVLGNIENKVDEIMQGFDIRFRMVEGKDGRLLGKMAGNTAEHTMGPGELQFIENLLNQEVFTPMLSRATPGARLHRITGKEVNAARRRLDTKFEELSPRGQAVLTKLKDNLNQIVDSMLPEGDPFPAARRIHSDEKAFLRQIETAMGTASGPERETLALLRNINSIFNDSNAAPKLAMIDRLNAATGVPFKALLAGRAMSPIVPKGLVGRGSFIAAVSVLTPVSLAYTLPSTVIFSPRFVGNVLASMGAAAKPIKDTVTLLRTLKRLPGIDQLVDEGVNLAALTTRVMEQEAQEPSQPRFFQPLRGQ